jgi:hypothetical protein
MTEFLPENNHPRICDMLSQRRQANYNAKTEWPPLEHSQHIKQDMVKEISPDQLRGSTIPSIAMRPVLQQWKPRRLDCVRHVTKWDLSSMRHLTGQVGSMYSSLK